MSRSRQDGITAEVVILLNIDSFVGLKLYQHITLLLWLVEWQSACLCTSVGLYEEGKYQLLPYFWKTSYLTKRALVTSISFAWGFLLHEKRIFSAHLLQPFTVKVICSRQTVGFCIVASVEARISMSLFLSTGPGAGLHSNNCGRVVHEGLCCYLQILLCTSSFLSIHMICDFFERCLWHGNPKGEI